MTESQCINTLREHVQQAAKCSIVPYSRQTRAALVLLSNGDWACGVRIENASFSLIIPALTSAVVQAASIGRRDIVALAFSGEITVAERIAASQYVSSALYQLDKDVLWQPDHPYLIGNRLQTCMESPERIDSATGITLARQATKFAYTPESNFPVGAIIAVEDHKYFQGVNIENSDWTHISCAERVAIAAAVSAGYTTFTDVFLSSPKSCTLTPCGACRQVLHEIAPDSIVWIDRGENEVESFRTVDLLPNAFQLKC